MDIDQQRFRDELAEMRKEIQRLELEGGKVHDMNRGMNKMEEREPGVLKKVLRWIW